MELHYVLAELFLGLAESECNDQAQQNAQLELASCVRLSERPAGLILQKKHFQAG
jgi:hypothetical protein